MSDKELNRINVIQAVSVKRLRQRDAASQLNLTERQIQRLVNRYRELGLAGLAHAQRGKQGNNCFPDTFKLRVMALVNQNYSDFGPTLATEKLFEKHNIIVSVETLRKWMISEGLWVPYVRRKPRVYQPRSRRDCLGELIQLDGSHHDWFEGRAPKCCLLVFVDDATGCLMHLSFGETESAFDYMLATREYIEKHGKPLAFYSDTLPNIAIVESKGLGKGQRDSAYDAVAMARAQGRDVAVVTVDKAGLAAFSHDTRFAAVSLKPLSEVESLKPNSSRSG